MSLDLESATGFHQGYNSNIVNHATDYLNTYVYHEGEVENGVNNVTSLVWKKLYKEDIIKAREDYRKVLGESLICLNPRENPHGTKMLTKKEIMGYVLIHLILC